MKKMTLSQLIERYEELCRPSVLFKNKDEVVQFLTDATDEDLQAFIKACVEDEAYEYAQIAKDMQKNLN